MPVAGHSHLGRFSGAGGGESGPSSENQRESDSNKATDSDSGLPFIPVDRVLSGLRHPDLLTQVILLSTLSGVTTALVISAIGFLLGLLGNWRRQWLGGLLLLLGLCGLGGTIALCFAWP